MIVILAQALDKFLNCRSYGIQRPPTTDTSVLGCPDRIYFSRANMVLVASSGRVTSVSAFKNASLRGIIWASLLVVVPGNNSAERYLTKVPPKN